MGESVPISVGLCGYGTVGGALGRLLRDPQQRALIRQKTNIDICLRRVYLRRSSPRRAELPEALVCESYEEIVADPKIDVVVELIGGSDEAFSLVRRAIRAGKSVVTANKRLVADALDSLASEATTYGVFFGMRGAVLGASPLLYQFASLPFYASELLCVLNGTCNFILTRMEEDGLDFMAALREAQARGFAEADPSVDIRGADAAQKLSILSYFLIGQFVHWEQIPTEGIDRLAQADVAYAESLSYRIRLIGQARVRRGWLETRVYPALIPAGHSLALVKNESNAVLVIDEMGTPREVVHPGAGGEPTARAVLTDIIGAALKENPLTLERQVELEVKDPEDFETEHYLRIPVEDEPGVLSSVSGILARRGISIAAAIQHPTVPVDIVLTTHKAEEGVISGAVREIDQQPFVRGRTVRLRVLA